MNTKAHWNDLKFQLHCNNLDWVQTQKSNTKKNPFCSSNHKLYTKDVKQACYFVGQSKLKPIDRVALFNLQD